MAINIYDFDKLVDSLIAKAEPYLFNLNDLPDCNVYSSTSDIRQHELFIELFKKLDSKRRSCLYWFELEDNDACHTLSQLLNEKRIELLEKGRVVPVMNNNKKSNNLYVGIRRGGHRKRDGLSYLSGRIVQHLGYARAGSTQGLQLAFWACSTGYNIRLNIIEFDENFPNEYLGAIEKIMAYKLKPLCGKH